MISIQMIDIGSLSFTIYALLNLIQLGQFLIKK
jgi:hypothetical protein